MRDFIPAPRAEHATAPVKKRAAAAKSARRHWLDMSGIAGTHFDDDDPCERTGLRISARATKLPWRREEL
jgi:hypothetical protein